MKKILRLLLDLVIAAGIVTAVVLGIVAITGIPDDFGGLFTNAKKLLDSEASTEFWLAMSGIAAAALAAIPTTMSIIFFFRKRESWGWTITSGVLMVAAIILTAIAAHDIFGL